METLLTIPNMRLLSVVVSVILVTAALYELFQVAKIMRDRDQMEKEYEEMRRMDQ